MAAASAHIPNQGGNAGSKPSANVSNATIGNQQTTMEGSGGMLKFSYPVSVSILVWKPMFGPAKRAPFPGGELALPNDRRPTHAELVDVSGQNEVAPVLKIHHNGPGARTVWTSS